MSSNEPEPPVRVLVVDDDPAIRAVLAATLTAHDDIVVVGEASDGCAGVERAMHLHPDVIVMDVEMPRLSGFEATTQIMEAVPTARIIALTGVVDDDAVTRMIVAGAVGYAVKGTDPDILVQVVRNAVHSARFVDTAVLPGLFDSVIRLARDETARREEAERLADELQRSMGETVRALVNALQSRDEATESHGDRVARWVAAVGRRLGLDGERMRNLEYGAVFHDIGKIGVPDEILHNTDELTPEEWRVIKQHTIVGERILEPVEFLRPVAHIVRHSHEHYDGSGYPDGLVGEQIPLESRIVLACDAFDAMTTDRTYQRALDWDAAVDRLRELSGRHFDPGVVDALVGVLQAEPVPIAAAPTPAP